MSQYLLLADDLMPLARDGQKRVTVRKGRRDVNLGDLEFRSTNGTEEPFSVNVTRVEVTKLIDVPTWALDGEGLKDDVDLFNILQRFYPDISFGTEITSIEFQR